MAGSEGPQHSDEQDERAHRCSSLGGGATLNDAFVGALVAADSWLIVSPLLHIKMSFLHTSSVVRCAAVRRFLCV